jgi:hypothetical protein
MQNVYFNEVEAAYMRRRVQDAVVASGLAAQAAPRSTRNRRLFFPVLVHAYLRAREVLQRQRPALGPIPSGRELPAA